MNIADRFRLMARNRVKYAKSGTEREIQLTDALEMLCAAIDVELMSYKPEANELVQMQNALSQCQADIGYLKAHLRRLDPSKPGTTVLTPEG